MSYISLCTLFPRFIINIRELYARDSEGYQGKGIDTAFGIVHDVGGTTDLGGDIIFAGVGPGEESEESEVIRLEAR